MRNIDSTFAKNIFFAFFAQGISLGLSVFMSLIVPKILGVEQYSYWQLFIFYVGYVGFFHFGLNDGVYLRLGGADYEKLEYSVLASEFRILFYIEIFMAGIISLTVSFMNISSERKYVLFMSSIYLVISNLSLFLGYIFQAVNMTKIYSMSIIWDRVLVIVSFVALISFRVTEFYIYVIFYAISKFISLIYCAIKGKELIFTRFLDIKSSLSWVKKDIGVGINITVANIAGNFILGIGRIVVDRRWGIESFGKFSFSLSLTSFFLLFISQISMVLFPALRKVEESKVKETYVKLRFLISIFLPCAFIVYTPMKIFLLKWLPAYQESFRYMILLLPICAFDGKMQLLCNTYLKVLRKERILLEYNLLSLAVSVAACLFSGYILNNILAVAVAMVFAIAVRSIISEMYLARLMEVRLVSQIFMECAFVVLFITVNWHIEEGLAFTLTIAGYMIYFIFAVIQYRKGEVRHV